MKILEFLRSLFRRKKSDPPKDSEKGAITVAETLIALGIGATIIGVVFAGIPAMINARNSSTGLNGLMQISTVVRNTYGIRNNYNGLNSALAIRLAGFPPHFVVDGDALHPWGGAIEINVDAANAQRFTITFEDMPADGCSQIVAATQDAADALTIDGTALGDNLGNDPNAPDPAEIGDVCDGDNDIVWTFGG